MNRWIDPMASRDQRSLGWYGRIATPELPTGLVRARQRAMRDDAVLRAESVGFPGRACRIEPEPRHPDLQVGRRGRSHDPVHTTPDLFQQAATAATLRTAADVDRIIPRKPAAASSWSTRS
ncbi:MAG TPA: hypothetical protein VN969_08330 [Streptosporangiaceae bacterium]|nr:hypothetical protein [Streptosporangiaceae bacterium]